ncbi:MAG: citrate synthase, partial [Clostridia bacterium]|nr:citrate synthase [Clostridia bacterium]
MCAKLNIESLAGALKQNSAFDEKLYSRFGVKRGLRNPDGTGVLAGITRVSNVHGYYIDEYEKVPCEGELFYRGVNVNDIIASVDRDDRFGYEEASWLLLFGSLPTREESFRKLHPQPTPVAVGQRPSPSVSNATTL